MLDKSASQAEFEKLNFQLESKKNGVKKLRSTLIKVTTIFNQTTT